MTPVFSPTPTDARADATRVPAASDRRVFDLTTTRGTIEDSSVEHVAHFTGQRLGCVGLLQKRGLGTQYAAVDDGVVRVPGCIEHLRRRIQQDHTIGQRAPGWPHLIGCPTDGAG